MSRVVQIFSRVKRSTSCEYTPMKCHTTLYRATNVHSGEYTLWQAKKTMYKVPK